MEMQTVDPDEVAHHDPPHLDLGCLQIDWFNFGITEIITKYSP